MKPNQFYIFVSSFLFLVSSFFSPVYAQHFSSSSYIIDWGNFNITSGHKNSTTYRLTDTVGQNAPGFSQKIGGLKVKAGFQYIYDTFTEFSFSIDKLNINFGTLTPGVGVTDTNILTITTPSGHGYQITAQENHYLWTTPNNYIPDTSCDNQDCTESLSTEWVTNTSYGFGFNVNGIGATGYFPSPNHYRPFANIATGKTPEIIISENKPVKNRTAIINYKVLISSLQSAGKYENFITYTVTPKY